MLYNPHFQYRTIKDFVTNELAKEAEKQLKTSKVFLELFTYCEENKKMLVVFKNDENKQVQYYCYCEQTSDSYRYVYMLVDEYNKKSSHFNSPLKTLTKVSTEKERELLCEYKNFKKGLKNKICSYQNPTPLLNFISPVL